MLSPQRVNPMTVAQAAVESGKPHPTNEPTSRHAEKLVLKVGTHQGCGGSIVYVSQFLEVCDRGKNICGPNQPREKAKCACKKCKLHFNPYFPVYRIQVTAWRERTD